MAYTTDLQQVIAYLKQGSKLKPPPAKPPVEHPTRPVQQGAPHMPISGPPKVSK